VKNLARNLMRGMDWKLSLKNSFKNFHAVGLNYICLHRSNYLTVKLYITEPGVAHIDGQFLVNPHDHGYNFETHVLRGWMTNICFREKPLMVPDSGLRWHRFNYFSPLRGGDGFKLRHDCQLECESYKILQEGDSYYLTTEQIHTIQVAANERTVLLLLQYRDDPNKPFTRFFSRSDSAPSVEGLAAVAADLAKFKAQEHPTLGKFQALLFNVDGSSVAQFRFGCLLFGPDGQPAQYKSPVGRH
jgi:hypothetical protein